jgi:quercetin dioxygenase-like cupin family protein
MDWRSFDSHQVHRTVRREERLMRWGSVVVLLVMLASAVVVGGMSPNAFAQDATPAAGQQGEMPEGVSARAVASGSLEVLAPGTAFLSLGRIALDPGSTISFDPMDPSAVLVYAASGELTFRVEAPMTIARRGATGTPVAQEPEAVEANTEFTLREGDSALFPPAIAGEVRNDGAEPATAWVVNVALQTAAATPTP